MKRLFLFISMLMWSHGAFCAMSFSGTNQYVSTIGVVSSYDFIQKTGIFSITAWIKLGNNSGAYAVAGNNAGASANNGFAFVYSSAGGPTAPFKTMQIFVTKGSAGNPTYSCWGGSSTINDTNWHFVAVTSTRSNLSNSGITFYIDGISTNSFNSTQVPSGFSVASAANALCIGSISPAGFDIFNGMIEDLRIYNRTLSSQEIKSLYFSRSRILITDKLSGWWPLDEGPIGSSPGINAVLDRSGNKNNGSGSNRPTYQGSVILNYQ